MKAEAFDIDGYNELLVMQVREGRSISSLATRMRLSQQSLYDKSKKKLPPDRQTTLGLMKTAKKRKPKALRTRAERNIAWIEEHCCIPEGRKIGKPFIVPDYMRADFIDSYDNKAAITRRAIITRGRKNLKTSQSALIVLLHLCGPEAQPNSQLYSTALSRDQAGILFSIASKIVRLSPMLGPVTN
jgi:phage terminase large subunit-like protein